MASISRSISSRLIDGKAQIMVRVSITRSYRPCLKTGLFVDPDWFYDGKIRLRPHGKYSSKEKSEVELVKKQLDDFCVFLIELINFNPHKSMDRKWLRKQMEKRTDYETYHKDNGSGHTLTVAEIVSYKPVERCIYEFFDDYINHKTLSNARKKEYKTLANHLKRYELFERYMGDDKFNLRINSLSSNIIGGFRDFLCHEYDLSQSYASIFKSINEQIGDSENNDSTLSNISTNTSNNLLKSLKAVTNWLLLKGVMLENPFNGIQIEKNRYIAHPVFITIEERKMLYQLDLSSQPSLERQRDVFVLQCLTGCRYGDLKTLTQENIIEGSFLQYVPKKTKKTVNPVIPKVPLSPDALSLIEKYRGVDKKGRLMPFATECYYNKKLRELFQFAGLTRKVQILNKHTGEPEMVSISDVVSSHMARRTFIGNLYNKIKDPSIISVMSGHVEGSRALQTLKTWMLFRVDTANALTITAVCIRVEE